MPPRLAITLPMLERFGASVAPETLREADRSVQVVWSSGERVVRFSFLNGSWFLSLSMAKGAAKLGPLNAGAPLLDSHRSGSLDSVIGVVESAKVDGKRGTARVRFSERAAVEPLWQDVRSGVLRNVSVGVEIHRLEELDPVEDENGERTPHFLATSFTPREISLVPVGADTGAQVMAPDNRTPCMVQFRAGSAAARMMEGDMPDELDNIETEVETEAETTPKRGPRGPRRGERERIQGLLALGKKHSVPETMIEKFIADGVTVAAASLDVLDWLAREDEKYGPAPGGSAASHSFAFGEDHTDPAAQMDRMAEALSARAMGRAPAEPARQFMHLTLEDTAVHCLRAAGLRVPLGKARRHELALHSTSDYPLVLADAAYKSMRQGYDAAPAGVRSVARKTTARDFKTRHRIALGEAPTLAKVNEHGEFTRGSMLEAEETYKVETFGRVFGITRQALVNDDLDAFGDLPVRLGRAATEFEAQKIVDLLWGSGGLGPVMSDTKTLFHADHANVGSGAIGISSLDAARTAMRTQKGISGTPINCTPRFLLVPAAKETAAEQILAEVQAAVVANVNVFAGKLELVVDPRLDAKSAIVWWLVADNASIDTLEYAHLEGEEGPQIATREGFDIDGLEVRVRLDLGVGALDHRGLYRSTGA